MSREVVPQDLAVVDQPESSVQELDILWETLEPIRAQDDPWNVHLLTASPVDQDAVLRLTALRSLARLTNSSRTVIGSFTLHMAWQPNAAHFTTTCPPCLRTSVRHARSLYNPMGRGWPKVG